MKLKERCCIQDQRTMQERREMREIAKSGRCGWGYLIVY
jgi:hypothetical protein